MPAWLDGMSNRCSTNDVPPVEALRQATGDRVSRLVPTASWRTIALSLLGLGGCSSSPSATDTSMGGSEDDGAVPSGGYCSPCEEAEDCERGACLVNNATGERFCGQSCGDEPCPDDSRCLPIDGVDDQCVPAAETCVASGDDDGSDSEPPPPPPAGDCDPAFLGPFCTGTVCDEQGNCETVENNPRIIGLDLEAPEDPTLDEVRAYTLAAVNAIRRRTCLPELVLDDCLHGIAEAALAANAGHGYFIEHCMNGEYDYGRRCECNWTQENIGAAFGSSRTWVDGIHSPLCRMMTEPKGQGHRSNIEASPWTRLGVGIEYGPTGAQWYHEFGCDEALDECPKN